MKILSIVGTRPEAIKMAPVIKELERHPEIITSRVCATAQHRELVDQVFNLFDIRPDYDLDLMRPSQSCLTFAATALKEITPVLRGEAPDWVLVQGDTMTAMLGAMAGFYEGVKVAHIEAGLRTKDRHQPFPEEINRRLIGVMAELHFAATEEAKQNLLRENTPERAIVVTGNPVIDALFAARKMSCQGQMGNIPNLPSKMRIVLVTVHRRENHGEPLLSICSAVRSLAERYRGTLHFVWPVHPSLEVKITVESHLANVDGVSLMSPLSYLEMVHLLSRSWIALTDSGGFQEEAPSLGLPVLVLRNRTERPEAVAVGGAKLVGTRAEDIMRSVAELIDCPNIYSRMATPRAIYGDGFASRRIVKALLATRTGGSHQGSRSGIPAFAPLASADDPLLRAPRLSAT